MEIKIGNFRFSTILFIVFLVLKLTHVIDWSWWWVTSPLWIPIAITILIYVGLYIWSKLYIMYQCKHDERFKMIYEAGVEYEKKRKAMEKLNKGKSLLQIRMEEMQRERNEIEKGK